MRNLQQIKVVDKKEDGENYVDNHSGQNYNVEQSCIFSHEVFPFIDD